MTLLDAVRGRLSRHSTCTACAVSQPTSQQSSWHRVPAWTTCATLQAVHIGTEPPCHSVETKPSCHIETLIGYRSKGNRCTLKPKPKNSLMPKSVWCIYLYYLELVWVAFAWWSRKAVAWVA